MELVNGSQLGLGDAIRAPEIEQSGSPGSGALRLPPLDILKYRVDFLLA